MNTSHLYRRLQAVVFFVLSLTAAAPSSATEPLLDMYSDGARTGRIFPSECCYVALPDNKRIWEMRKRERCSAMGGPVGVFKLEEGKLWLTGLFKCSGQVAAQEVYPDMKTPALADWLSGTFKTVIGTACDDGAGHTLYPATQQLTVDKGVVRSLTETANDLTACSKRP